MGSYNQTANHTQLLSLAVPHTIAFFSVTVLLSLATLQVCSSIEEQQQETSQVKSRNFEVYKSIDFVTVVSQQPNPYVNR